MAKYLAVLCFEEWGGNSGHTIWVRPVDRWELNDEEICYLWAYERKVEGDVPYIREAYHQVLTHLVKSEIAWVETVGRADPLPTFPQYVRRFATP